MKNFSTEESKDNIRTIQNNVQNRTVVKTQISSKIPEKIRILIVDDSSTIRKVLQKIFSSDPRFEVVGTAENGEKAHEFLRENKVDAMTLDIHMPVLNGLEYMQKYYNSNHPRVVVSSASREDAIYSQEILKAGACDFIEKPEMNNNIAEKGEEIYVIRLESFI